MIEPLKFALIGIVNFLVIITFTHHSFAANESELCRNLLAGTDIWENGEGEGLQNFKLSLKNLCISKLRYDNSVPHGTEMTAESQKKKLTMVLVESYSEDLCENNEFDIYAMKWPNTWCQTQANIVTEDSILEGNIQTDERESTITAHFNGCMNLFSLYSIRSFAIKSTFEKIYTDFTIYSLDYEHENYFPIVGRPLMENEQFYMKKFLIPYYEYVLEEVKFLDSGTYRTIQEFCEDRKTLLLMKNTNKVWAD